MKLMHAAAFGAAVCLITAPADAQFGNFVKMLGKGSSATNSTDQTTSGDDADLFLDEATKSTKNVMIAAAILAQAVTNAKDLTSCKAYIDAVSSAQNPKEVGAHMTELSSNLEVLSKNKDLGGNVTEAMKSMTAKQREQVGLAVINMAIGIARNVDLATKAPKVVTAIGHNPMLLTRAGQFKLAASLVGLQAKGLAGLAGSMPKLIAATKVKVPSDPKATPATITLL